MGAFRIAVVVFLLGSWSRSASADPLQASVTVERSEESLDCPHLAQLLPTVELILERPVQHAQSARVKVEVRFFKEGDEFRAHLRLEGSQSGERLLTDPSPGCAPLAQAVSVTMALFFDQEFAHDSVPPPTENDLAPASEGNDLAPANAAPEAPPAPAKHKAMGRVHLGVGAAFGMGADSAALLGGGLSLSFGRLQLGADLSATTSTAAPLAPGRVNTQLLFANVQGCFLLGDRWSFGPCALVGVGLLRGTGVGFEQEASEALAWTALGPGFSLRGPFGLDDRFFWGTSGALWIPTQSQEFRVENVGTAWESPAPQGTLSGQVGLRLW